MFDRIIYKFLVFILIVFQIVSCNTKDQKQKETGAGKKKIVTTTGMIRDAVYHIVKDAFDVEALMGPGVDPHLYKTSQGDLRKLQNAEIVFYNGLHLEGKMGEILEKLGRTKPVIAVSNGVSKEKLHHPEGFEDVYDPHIWFDVSLWKDAVKFCADYLVERYPDQANAFRANANDYLKKLDSLHIAVGEKIQTIPERQRLLITAHDAFGYFGSAYNIEVKGLQGLSTLSDFGLFDISNLVELIISRNIKAVFVESSVSEKAILAVVEGCKKRGHQVEIGGKLYSDAMGEEGSIEGTYIGMINANVNVIVQALK